MDLKAQFDSFLSDIRLTQPQRDELKDGHWRLRERLAADDVLSPIIIGDFLQGSYRRATATRPKNGGRADVDIIVVTRISEHDHTPQQAMNRFVPFLERHYKDKWEFQGRSIGITMSDVSLDVVVTSAPSEAVARAVLSEAVSVDQALDEGGWVPSLNWRTSSAEWSISKHAPQWQLEPLRIPDRDAKQWDDTHPLEQMRWTWNKNHRCNGHYVNVVKAIKWFRRVWPDPKYPKGYPVEHLVGESCPDGISSVAEGATRALEGISTRYQAFASARQTPFVADHGVSTHNVLRRVSGEHFAQFHALVRSAAEIARRAFDSDSRDESTQLWQKLFGSKFPDPPDRGRGGGDQGGGGYTPRGGPSTVPPGRERWG